VGLAAKMPLRQHPALGRIEEHLAAREASGVSTDDAIRAVGALDRLRVCAMTNPSTSCSRQPDATPEAFESCVAEARQAWRH
jgi:hypothetical protein